jgi:thiol:disulfide interchange protein/DsbC/DsbD-like thiol-disulfide interchange protein
MQYTTFRLMWLGEIGAPGILTRTGSGSIWPDCAAYAKNALHNKQVAMQKVPCPWLCLIYAIICVASAPNAFGQTAAERGPLVRIELLAEKAAARPGDTVTIALRQLITPGWHTYWSNPGDSGEPTRIDWRLPAGASGSAIAWPLPKAIPVGPLMNYGYSGEILLLSEITLPRDLAGDSVDIAADVKWLVCEEICVPEEASVRLALPLIEGPLSPRPSPHASAIAAARKKVPGPAPWRANFQTAKDGVVLKIDGIPAELSSASEIRFFPLEWGRINHAAPQTVAFRDGDLLMRLAPGDLTASAGSPLEGLLAVENRAGAGTERQGYSISAVAAPASAAPVEFTPLGAASEDSLTLGLAVAFAFLGGIILNCMPCVFPVLSLKALSLAKDAGNGRARRVKGAVYLAGVLTSFLAIGVAVLAMRMGGAAVGWGMQFQSPAFVLFMMALFLGLALNMSGVFAIGSRIAGAGDGFTRRPGLAGYFFTGVLATLVATPCTAPFMGAAIGYAFSQPAAYIFAVLLALGLGFALPIVLLSLTPALGRWLPKPGAWMETFKQLMAFPLYATVAWLVWVLSVQQGSDGVLAASLTLLGTSFAAWLLGRRAETGTFGAATAASLAIGAIVLGVASLPPATATQPLAAAAHDAGPRSESFTAARLAELRAQSKPVFVNLTAAWCITCKVNERLALRSGRVADAFTAHGIAYLVGDWTNGNPEITALLKAHGRVGVPLYLLYSGAADAKPTILPQLLTESIVLNRIAGLSSPSQKEAKGDI